MLAEIEDSGDQAGIGNGRACQCHFLTVNVDTQDSLSLNLSSQLDNSARKYIGNKRKGKNDGSAHEAEITKDSTISPISRKFVARVSEQKAVLD